MSPDQPATSPGTQDYWTVVTPVQWPAGPSEMSVSAFAELEECPRRWALGAAEYPAVWSGRGYPARLQPTAIAGSVVHLALEIITKELTRSGISSPVDPAAPAVLKRLGGLTAIVEDCATRILGRYADNPRALAHLESAQRSLRGQVPALRSRVQALLARLNLRSRSPSAPASASPTASARQRVALTPGSYAEVELRARDIRWKGKVDLLVLDTDYCEITDFKTGQPKDAHRFQVRVYAALWRLDGELNPSGLIARRLVLAYEADSTEVPAPTAEEINDLASELATRRQRLDDELAFTPPPARPSVDACRYCAVRQLCDAYWSANLPLADGHNDFGDAELKVVGRHGPKSWDAIVLGSRHLRKGTPVLLRLQEPTELPAGTRLRVLDGKFTRDAEDDSAPSILTVGSFSEYYRLR